MLLIGLTGGIASGKTTVARLLEKKGAVVIDADRLGHEAYLPGTDVHRALVERFGADILDVEGAVDRPKLGRLVFADSDARRDLESLVHPAIFRAVMARLDELKDSNQIVVLDAALLVEGLDRSGNAFGLDLLVVVSTEVHEMVRRMIDERDMDEPSARARIAAQAPIERKMAAADYVIDNRGTREDLERSVDVLWKELNDRLDGNR